MSFSDLISNTFKKVSSVSNENYTMSLSMSDNATVDWFSQAFGLSLDESSKIAEKATEEIIEQRIETLRSLEQELQEKLDVEPEDLRLHDEKLQTKTKGTAYAVKPDLNIPEKTYSKAVRDEITGIKITPNGDVFTGSSFRILADKKAAYVRLPNSLVPIPNEVQLISEPDRSFIPSNTLSMKILDKVEESIDKPITRYFSVTEETLDKVDEDFPKYRSTVPDGYYHPYDSVARLPRDILDAAYKESSLRKLVRTYDAYRRKRGGEDPMRIGVIISNLDEYDRLKQVFSAYEIMTIQSASTPDIIVYQPYKKFPSFSTMANGAVFESWLSDTRDAINTLAPHWRKCDNLVVGFDSFRLRDWNTGSFRIAVSPCSPHRARVFVMSAPLSMVSDQLFYWSIKDGKSTYHRGTLSAYSQWIVDVVSVSAHRNKKLTDPVQYDNYWTHWGKYQKSSITDAFHRWFPGLVGKKVRTVSLYAPINKRRDKVSLSDIEFQFLVNMGDNLYREEAFYDAGIYRTELERLVFSGRLRPTPVYDQIFYALQTNVFIDPGPVQQITDPPKISVLFHDKALNVDYNDFLSAPVIVPANLDTVRMVLNRAVFYRPDPGILFSAADQNNVIIKREVIL